MLLRFARQLASEPLLPAGQTLREIWFAAPPRCPVSRVSNPLDVRWSDAPANPRVLALTSSKETGSFEVDNAPPRIKAAPDAAAVDEEPMQQVGEEIVVTGLNGFGRLS